MLTMFDFSSVYQAYIACRRGKRTSHNTQSYEVRLLDHLVNTSEALQSRRWLPARSVSFVCTRPKAREIHAADFADRVVHHILVPKLEAMYEAIFIDDSYSNRKAKGTHAAVDRLQSFMRKVSCNGKRKAFFLQLDIRNFFNRIDRSMLLKLLQTRLYKSLMSKIIDHDEYEALLWLCTILLAENAADQAIQRGSSVSFEAVPPYKRLSYAPEGCGIAIGNLTSQFFANVYLNELDQFVKHQLKCRCYVRYVDDFVLLHESEAQLLTWREDIQLFLATRLHLALKEVAQPCAVSSGCDFLGYVTRPHYRLVRRRVFDHCMEKLSILEKKLLRRQAGALSIHLKSEYREALHATLASYMGHFLHADSFHLEQKLFSRFSWLYFLFQWHERMGDKRKLRVLWQPPVVSSFQGQYSWFQACFCGFIQMIQVGRNFACSAKDMHFLPVSARRKMKKSQVLSIDLDMYVAPLTILKGIRSYLRWAKLAHLFVAEEGYEKKRLKHRVLRLLWQPRQVCLGV